MADRIALGLMSGTSADGIDAVAIRFSGRRPVETLGSVSHEYPATLRRALLDLGREDARITPRQWGELDAAVGTHYAELALALLATISAEETPVSVIGMHGQTVFHAPGINSLQMGDPNRVAAATGITTVADLRRRDLAAGGQGAPMVPGFHAEAFGIAGSPRIVVNVGGIANLSHLPGDGSGVIGFDTGPANTLMDAWCSLHLHTQHDENGNWAASGQVRSAMLAAWLSEAYFRAPIPKSTGCGLFNLDWCRALYPDMQRESPADVQRTLLELSAITIAEAIRQRDPDARAGVFVCGGGTRNGLLMARLAELLMPRPVATTRALGIDPQQVEASAFAWLALCRLDGVSGVLPSVTGASRATVTGGIYSGE